MSQFFLSFLATSLFMAVVIVAVLALRALFPNTFTPRVRYVVWIIILLGLAIPVRPFFADGIIDISLPFAISTEGQTENMVVSADSSSVTGSADAIAAAQSLPAAQETFAPAASGIGSGVAGSLQALSTFEMLALIWATIALGVLMYHAWKHISFFRLVRRWASPVDDKEALDTLQAVKAEKGISKEIRLKKCGFISTSMIVGFFRPMILLPEKDFSISELEMIFHHELVHWQRGDLFVKLLSVVALSLNWFNPAVYVMNAVMQADCEASCDQLVIASVGSGSRHFYAETLIEMIGYRSANKTILSTCFCGSKRGIKTRMEAIMSATDNGKKIAVATLATSLFTLVLVLGLVVVAGSVFAFSGQGQQDLEYVADSIATYDSDDDINPFSWEFTENGEEAVFQLEDGTSARVSVSEHGTLSIHSDYGTTHSTIPSYPPGGTSISPEEALQIAKEDLATRNIAATLDKDPDTSWEFDEVWVWVLQFNAQGDRIRYLIFVDTGDIIYYEHAEPPFDIG